MSEAIRRVESAPAVLRGDASLLVLSLPSTSVGGAALMLFKAIVGAALFALPFAFRLMGIGGAMIAMAVLGLLTFYTGMVIVRVHDVVVRDTLRHDMTFVSLTEFCFGRWPARAAFALLVVTTLGSCGAYMYFIATVLESIWPAYSGLFFAGVTAAAVSPLVLVRDRRVLVWSSAVGNVGVAFVVLVFLVRGAGLADWQPATAYTAFDAGSFMQAFGMVGFLYAVAPTLITIEKSMRGQRQGFGRAYFLATLAAIFLCSAFGLTGYLMFGAGTCSIVVLNLGSGPLAAAAKLGIVADLALTFPITLAAAREAVELALFTDATPWLSAKRNVLSIALVAGSYTFTFIPGFSTIVNVVGAWSVSLFSFMLPPLMLMQLRRFHVEAHNQHIRVDAVHVPQLHAPHVPSASGELSGRGLAIAFDPYTAQLLATPPYAVKPRGILHHNSEPFCDNQMCPPSSRPAVQSAVQTAAAVAVLSLVLPCVPPVIAGIEPHGAALHTMSELTPPVPSLLPTLSALLVTPDAKIQSRHAIALELMGVGSPLEASFLVLVALFGFATLVVTTLQSVQAAAAGGTSGDACATAAG